MGPPPRLRPDSRKYPFHNCRGRPASPWLLVVRSGRRGQPGGCGHHCPILAWVQNAFTCGARSGRARRVSSRDSRRTFRRNRCRVFRRKPCRTWAAAVITAAVAENGRSQTMTRSHTSGLPDYNLADSAAHGGGESRALSGAGARNLSPIPLFPGAADLSAALSENKSRGTGGPGRIARTHLQGSAGALRAAADLCPLSRNAGATDLRFDGPPALHPGRELPHYAARNRGLNVF